jgi:tyrosyl-tRNA synthetase
MAAADSAQRYALIEENLAEVLNDEIIKKILDEGRHPKIYWGELRTNSLVVSLRR